ncbi:hypothetical protein AX16_007198 [Volvariella volvacea WC 439]|nr:hypothetical protein AX16_007198 [Volvariella volvacea WC 439]
MLKIFPHPYEICYCNEGFSDDCRPPLLGCPACYDFAGTIFPGLKVLILKLDEADDITPRALEDFQMHRHYKHDRFIDKVRISCRNRDTPRAKRMLYKLDMVVDGVRCAETSDEEVAADNGNNGGSDSEDFDTSRSLTFEDLSVDG